MLFLESKDEFESYFNKSPEQMKSLTNYYEN